MASRISPRNNLNLDIQTQTDTQEIPPDLHETHFIVNVSEHWHRMPREFVEFPSFKILKSCLDMFLGNQLQVVMLDMGDWIL